MKVSEKAFAAEDAFCPQEGQGENIVSVELPVQDENEGYPFDFILDPQGLIYETDAMRYGGGTVEEGATLLFRNREGEYDFSETSDRLTVTNRGSGSVRVTVLAQVSRLEEVSLQEDADFSESQDCSIYLALTDSEGHIQPLRAEEEILVACEMDSDTYSFGLTGACNSNADWEYTSVHLVVTVTWIVESMETQQKEIPGDETREAGQEGGATQENMPEGKGEDAGEEEAGMQETEPESEGADIGEGNAARPGGTSGKEDADMEGDNAGERKNPPENGGANIQEDNAIEQESPSENGGANIEEDNAVERGDASENGAADNEDDNTVEQMNPSENRHTETEIAVPAAKESTAEGEDTDSEKANAATPVPESGDSGTETEYDRAESEDKS